MGFRTFPGLASSRERGDLAELRVRKTQLIERYGADFQDTIMYLDSSGNLIVAPSGSGTAPTKYRFLIDKLSIGGGSTTITIEGELTGSIYDIGRNYESARAGYLTMQRTAVALSGNDQTLQVGGAGQSGFVALSDGGVARTGLRIAVGEQSGQLLILAHVGANPITFHTTEATSRVAGSATLGIISPLMAVLLIWDATTARWYPVRPLT